ncbi:MULTISPECIES: tRNA uracil 4-sulfurtransferase ThiI [Paenibacillus]|uniref:Probable tRNA sulfurtransferase n=1 Tax=Paenibacillus albilobatus TaxID=2716884 RepID=A0A919XDG4_9BACL|nr:MULTISPECIES: tRNA uracil 4-sulfurtransferase ThiI [Paenibacillus]GIO30514.1 putative tRNA sulfurtransferase [Paenibacillus albilobatus]
MKYDMLLLRLGELTLKGKNRGRFERTVLAHVKSVIRPFPAATIQKEYGRLYIVLNGEDPNAIIKVLKKVFGLYSVSPVAVCPSELDAIIETSRAFIKQMDLKDETTFKVTARRVWKAFPHPSQEMNHLVGSPLLSEFGQLKVSMRNPELELRIEIRESGTYIYCEVIPGAGGFPRGSNGKAMLLLSGGIDSPVAGYSAMRRGLEVECVHFYSYPFTSRKAKEKVMELAKVLSGYAGKIKIHLVPFTEIQTSFTQVGQDNLIITLMRRSMLRIATMLAEREGALAIVTGDSLGQVASQTLPSMNVIGRATELPLLRPLVMMDKNEIVEIAQEIGTYELSILPYEDCCTLFVPKSPTTNPNLHVVERVEASLENLPGMLEEAVQRTETVILTPSSVIAADREEAIEEDWF